MRRHLRIKDLPITDRPREKLIKYGPDRLSSAELLAIILRTGDRKDNALSLAKKIAKKFGDNLPSTTYAELKSFSVGDTKACEIISCFELGRRFLNNKQSSILLSPKSVWEELVDIRDKKKEHFIVFFLDTRNQKIKQDIVSIGTLNTNIVHPREVFEPAVRHLASQIIVAHNHPSGDVRPSKEDEKITRQLVDAGKLLDIPVLDHIIVSEKEYYSFASKQPHLFNNHE